jgi:hypothetical protein
VILDNPSPSHCRKPRFYTPDPLEEVLEPLWRVPSHLCVLLALLNVPDVGAPVLADGDHLGVVGAKVNVVNLLLVRLDLVHSVEVGKVPDAEEAVVAASGHQLVVGAEADALLVGVGGAEWMEMLLIKLLQL